MAYHLAVDIGASSGRHILGWLEGGLLRTREVYRFENKTERKRGRLCWDLEALGREVIRGLARCRELGQVPETVGVDTWAVDFALLDGRGQILGDTVAYRDSRTQGMDLLAEQLVSPQELYRRTGIQKQIFNTLYQLLAVKAQEPELLDQAESLLLVPDYLHFLLTGKRSQEYTNATTTGLVSGEGKDWDRELLKKLGLPDRLFGPLSLPGTELGGLRPALREELGFDCRVVLPATHDTGSAFLAVPESTGHWATLSSGTWSLLGLELPHPILTEESRERNYTNEGGLPVPLPVFEETRDLVDDPEPAPGVGKRGGAARLRGAVPVGPGSGGFPQPGGGGPPEFPGPGLYGPGGGGLLPPHRPARAGDPRGAAFLRVPQPGRVLRQDRGGAGSPDRPSPLRHPHRGRGQPGPVPEPAHRQRLRAAGHRRAHRGHGPGEPAGADDRRRGVQRPGGGQESHRRSFQIKEVLPC